MSDFNVADLAAGIFPADVMIASRRLGLDETPRFGFQAEADLVEGAVLKRRIEFSAGRELAHKLITDLHAADSEGALGPDGPLLSGSDRAPIWPAGIAGTITHTAGLCLVAVAPISAHQSLGVDVEVTAPLKEKLWPSVLTVSERARLVGMGTRGALFSKAHFCAKEAVYKLVSGVAGRVLEFEEVELGFSFAKGTFETRFLVDAEMKARLPKVVGHWRITREFIVTGAYAAK